MAVNLAVGVLYMLSVPRGYMEGCEAVQELLDDLQFLEDIQPQATSARELLFYLRFQRIDSIAPAVSRMEKLLKEQGFLDLRTAAVGGVLRF